MSNIKMKLKPTDLDSNGYVQVFIGKRKEPFYVFPENLLTISTEEISYSKEKKELPKIVCLCGSTRFHKEFVEQNYKETMKGNIILSVGFFMHSGEAHGEHIGITPEQKEELDELHKRKIDLADEIFVLNVGKYIGSSTRSEIEYAKKHRKGIRYLEQIEKIELFQLVRATDYEYPEDPRE